VTNSQPILRDANRRLSAEVRDASRFMQGANVGTCSLKGGHEVDRWTVDFVHLGLACVA